MCILMFYSRKLTKYFRMEYFYKSTKIIIIYRKIFYYRLTNNQEDFLLLANKHCLNRIKTKTVDFFFVLQSTRVTNCFFISILYKSFKRGISSKKLPRKYLILYTSLRDCTTKALTTDANIKNDKNY